MNYSEKLRHPKWQEKRLSILNRDNFTCRECSCNDKNIQVHHIAYLNVDPWDIPDNLLISLCETCHSNEEFMLKNMADIKKNLKLCGLMSVGFMCIPNIFYENKYRGWNKWDSDEDNPFAVLRMAVSDDDIWDNLVKLYKERHFNG